MTKMPADPASLERVLHALGDTVRLGIVRQLDRDGESSCAALNGNRSKSTMSHHFRVLRDAGLVETRVRGVTHINTLCRASIDAAFPGLLTAVLEAKVVGVEATAAAGRSGSGESAAKPSG